jgi:diguanylate cyclase
MDRLTRTVQWLAGAEPLRGATAIYAVGALALLIAACGWLVYATGGIRFVFSHSVYLPVVLAAFLFGAPGGLGAGVAAGLVLGPYMPIDTGTGELQSTLNWTYRLLFLVFIGGVTGALVSLLRRHIGRIQWLSRHDAETGIPNAQALLDEVRRVIAAGGGSFRLFVVDLCNHADITSTFGPEIGAGLTREVAARLRRLLHPHDLVCSVHTQRLGFVLSGRGASAAVQRLAPALHEPYVADGLSIYVDTAIGSAEFPLHGDSPDRLLQKAMIAMHAAARRGATHAAYDIAADRTSRENLALLGELAPAMRDGQLTLHFQPKIQLATGDISGVEALIRWQHPAKGWIAPGAFLPYAENSALIHPLSIWVFRRAVEQLAAWRRAGVELQVAVNISMRNLQEGSVVEAIEQLLRDDSFPNTLLEFEITESALLLDPQLAAKLFEQWRALGATIAVDDFGTGRASLSYVKDLPVDVLKIDQTFIKSLRENPRDQAIVRAAIGLAHDLRLRTVAEGVENSESLAYLRELGCDYAQGYGIQRPQPTDTLERWFAETSHGFRLRTPGALRAS